MKVIRIITAFDSDIGNWAISTQKVELHYNANKVNDEKKVS